MTNAGWQSGLWDHAVGSVKFRAEVSKPFSYQSRKGLGWKWEVEDVFEDNSAMSSPCLLFSHFKPSAIGGQREATWTNVWLLTQKYKRQECGWPTDSRWEQRIPADFLDQMWSLGERTGLGLFLILSKPGLSVGNPRLKTTMQCWGGTASERKMHPPGLGAILCSQ